FTDSSLRDKALINKEVDEHFSNRIIGYLTFALNYKLHGARVPGYHVFNVLVHLSNAILLYLLVLLTAKTPWFRKASGDKDGPFPYRIAALFAGLLFVSHPVQTQAVAYISQRFTSLSTMFCLISIVLYAKARIETEGHISLFSASNLPLYLVSVVSAVLAMKTKQIAFTLPVIVALYEVMFFEGNARKRLLYALPLLLTMLIVPLAVIEDQHVLTDIKRLRLSVHGGPNGHLELSYLLTQFRVIVTYLRLLVLPVNQNLDYDYPVYHSFLTPSVFLSFIFLTSIFVGGIYLYRKSAEQGVQDRQWLRITAFGIFWFFITLSVESSIIPLADLIFEHRLYLPSAGFFMIIVSAAAMGGRRLGKTGTEAITLFLTFSVLALSIATFQRNQLWGDNVSLWEDVVKKSPNKARPHNNLGVAYGDKGDLNKAVNEYLAALKIDPKFLDARVNLAVAYGKLDLVDMAISELLTALKQDPADAIAYNNLGVAYEKKGYTDKAMEQYLAALKISPDFAAVHNNLGILYRKRGDTNKAINEFKAVLKIAPDLAQVHNNLGFAYEKQGHIDEAIGEYLAALKINPEIAEVHHNLGIAYGKQGHTEKAISEFISALKLKPYLAIALDDLEANHAINIGRINEAVTEFRKTLSSPQNVNPQNNVEIPIEQTRH
ncbi:MAG: tetratricopeptide repeat protein, partial [Nitrospira sp.]|nr:tetratricopeptide repeat protein [Nitrospira sp.]